MSEVREIWDEGAHLYDQIYASNLPYHRSHEAIVELLPEARPIHVLDLGVGTGTLAKRILERLPASSVTCIDFSSSMLAECERKLAAFGPRVQLVCADIAVWPPPRDYGAVVACNTLVYKELDIGACYSKYAAVLAPGGLLLNSTVVQQESGIPNEVLASVPARDTSSPSRELLDFAARAGRLASFDEESLAIALPIDEHLNLMTEAGLTAACPWRYLIQALLVGLNTDT